MLKRRTKRKNAKYVELRRGLQTLTCSKCQFEDVLVALDVSSVICSNCVSLMVAPPEHVTQKKETTGMPRGWHFKKAFQFEGKYYSKGKEITKKEFDLLDKPAKTQKVSSVKRKTGKRRKRNVNTTK